MTKYFKHVGKIKNSGRRVVVIVNQIPGAEKNALVVDVDSVPDAYQQFLMDLVQSPAAQASNELGDVLNRYASPDAGKSMLKSLNDRQYLSPMTVTNILMYPAPNFPIELSQVIKLINGEDVEKIKNDHSVDTLHGTVSKLNAEEIEKNINVAKNILAEAHRLDFEAKKKRDQAYAMAPTLNPNFKGYEKQSSSLYDVTNTINHKYDRDDNIYGYNQPSDNPNIKKADISKKLGSAPPPIEVKLTPEEIMLKQLCDPNYVPEKITEDIKIEVIEKTSPKKRGRKPSGTKK